MITEAAIRATLNTITDPCSVAAGTPAGIEELGLIRRLELQTLPEGVRVKVIIGVTEPGCVMGYPFAEEAQRRLEALVGIDHVEIGLDHEHDWVPQDMAPEYRTRLAARRAARRGTTGDQLGLLPDGRPQPPAPLPMFADCGTN